MLGTKTLIQMLEDLIGHQIAIAKSAEVLALRETNPHNLREIQNITHHAKTAKAAAAEVRGQVKREDKR